MSSCTVGGGAFERDCETVSNNMINTLNTVHGYSYTGTHNI